MKHALKHALAAIFLVLSFALPVAAGPFEDAVAARNREDFATALRLLRPLAEQGEPRAQRYLGGMIRNGQGVPEDSTEAAKWFRKAAEQGDAFAQFYIGASYYNGNGVPRDQVQSLKWLRLAAAQGESAAQVRLGLAYHDGDGVPKDFVLSYMWFNLAAAQNEENAAGARDQLAQKMTPAQIAEAQKLAREWKPTKQPLR
jgi:TPR repeat protein